jgi:hypothetical protein
MKARIRKYWAPTVLLTSMAALVFAYVYATSKPIDLVYDINGVMVDVACTMWGDKVIDFRPPIWPPTDPPTDPTDLDPEPIYNHVEARFRVEDATLVTAEEHRAVLSPLEVTAIGTSASLGQITYTLDRSRSSTPTTVVGNVPFEDFPATINIYLPVEATVAINPEARYRSIGEVHLQSTDANSFNPFDGEDRFHLVEPVNFEDVNAPGIVVFTVTEVDMN